MIRSKSVSICNHSRARLVHMWQKPSVLRGYPNLMPSYGGFVELEPRGSNLTPLKSTFNAEHFISLVYLKWFRRNLLLQCILQPEIAKKLLKPLFWGFKVVQGHRCWYARKARQQCLLWCAASLYLSTTVLTLDEAILVKLRFLGGTPLWCPRSRGISSPSGTKLPRKKLETLGYHMVQTRSLCLTWAWYSTGSWHQDGQTDRQTDRIPIANTRSQQYLPVQLSRVKKDRHR